MPGQKIVMTEAERFEDRQGALGPLRRDRIAAFQDRLAAAKAFVQVGVVVERVHTRRPPSQSGGERGLLDGGQIPTGADQPQIASTNSAQKHGVVGRRLAPLRLERTDNSPGRAAAAGAAAASGQERRRARSARSELRDEASGQVMMLRQLIRAPSPRQRVRARVSSGVMVQLPAMPWCKRSRLRHRVGAAERELRRRRRPRPAVSDAGGLDAFQRPDDDAALARSVDTCAGFRDRSAPTSADVSWYSRKRARASLRSKATAVVSIPDFVRNSAPKVSRVLAAFKPPPAKLLQII